MARSVPMQIGTVVQGARAIADAAERLQEFHKAGHCEDAFMELTQLIADCRTVAWQAGGLQLEMQKTTFDWRY